MSDVTYAALFRLHLGADEPRKMVYIVAADARAAIAFSARPQPPLYQIDLVATSDPEDGNPDLFVIESGV